MRQPPVLGVALVILTSFYGAGSGPSAVDAQSRPDESTLIAHRYHVGQTASVRKEVDAQKTSPLEAKRDLARTEISEVLPVPPPRGLLVARTFFTDVASRLRGRVLDSCSLTDTLIACPTHYLEPQYPRVFLRLDYVYNQQEVELRLRAIHRSPDGRTTAAADRLSLEDAQWYQGLFLKLIDVTMERK